MVDSEAQSAEERHVKSERENLRKAGRLHWVHWLVVVSSLGLTLFAWQIAKSQSDRAIEERFNRQAAQVAELVKERMLKYEDALWGGVGAINAHSENGDIDYRSWLRFANSLEIDVKYPGINGIGVIYPVSKEQLPKHLADQRKDRPDYRVHPTHSEQEYLPITYIEPVASNRKAVGLDMAHETNRYTAAKKARDSGTTQITGPIVLVQDSKKTPGFLFYAPYYKGGPKASTEERRKHFQGIVYAPFIVSKLMDGTLARTARQVGVQILDGDESIYNEHSREFEDYDPNPMFVKKISMPLYGRTWNFDIWSALSFRAASSQSQPNMILIGGIIIDALLFLLFLLLSKANRRAVGFADRMTESLRERTKDLERSNAELEKFAYIASHDLRSPLRGIGDLSEYLQEDLEGYLEGPDANPDVEKNLGRIKRQILRMEGLIKGILEFSSIGHHEPKITEVDLSSLIVDCIDGSGLKESQLIIPQPLPSLTTDELQLGQIFSNLLGNAYKYNQDQENARVEVTWKDDNRYFTFSVKDNGPGIDPKFHKKIFEAFQTLQPRDVIESTGVGLSVVKKIVEAHGGRVWVDSDEGKGATFIFEWPKQIPTKQEKQPNLAAA